MARLLTWFCVFLGFLWTVLMSLEVIVAHWLHKPWAVTGERIWARGWCRLMGIRVRYHGLENLNRAPAFVVAPNHSSNFDIMVLSTLPHPFKYLSKKEVRYLPFLGQALDVIGTYWVRRDKSGRDLEVMSRIERGLQNGVSVLIFPEGTRTRSGQLLPFKKGPFRTALNAGVPLLPIAISGTFAIWPPGKLPSRRGFDVVVRIGEPYRPAPDAPLESVIAGFRQVLVGLLEENNREMTSR